ncbi:hypothetical protein CcaCcLH18_11847 [Colletotrichum camelliae]|nr:hypothetical protein CcaCcLH18_11847 [Colletotrichum camelliae]
MMIFMEIVKWKIPEKDLLERIIAVALIIVPDIVPILFLVVVVPIVVVPVVVVPVVAVPIIVPSIVPIRTGKTYILLDCEPVS